MFELGLLCFTWDCSVPDWALQVLWREGGCVNRRDRHQVLWIWRSFCSEVWWYRTCHKVGLSLFQRFSNITVSVPVILLIFHPWPRCGCPPFQHDFHIQGRKERPRATAAGQQMLSKYLSRQLLLSHWPELGCLATPSHEWGCEWGWGNI